MVTLAAADPANPYGAVLEWPPPSGAGRRLARAVGARVILVDGALAAYLARGGRQLFAWLPEQEPDRSRVGGAASRRLAELARAAQGRHEATLIAEIDGAPARQHPFAGYLAAAGFQPSSRGLQLERPAPKGH